MERIVTTPDVLDGEPRIDGRRIGVRLIHALVERKELMPWTVADRYDLDVADVYLALAYYDEHPSEMASLGRKRGNSSNDEVVTRRTLPAPTTSSGRSMASSAVR